MNNQPIPGIMNESDGAKLMCEQIRSAQAGWAAGKLGTSELNALLWYIYRKQKNKLPYPERYRKDMFINAGLWAPPDKQQDTVLDEWAADMFEAIKLLDGAAIWNPVPHSQQYEASLLRDLNPNIKTFKLRCLEPYYSPTEQYTLEMTKGSIAVVSPFATSIYHQLKRMGSIFPEDGKAGKMWPDNQVFHTILAKYGPNMTTKDPSLTWDEAIIKGGYRAAVKDLADKVQVTGARYAFVGIGAISLLLVAELKRRGLVAIHTGGGTQIMFGVKGRRWENHSVISTFFNNSWVRPEMNEIPTEAMSIEGACYW